MVGTDPRPTNGQRQSLFFQVAHIDHIQQTTTARLDRQIQAGICGNPLGAP